MKADQKDSIPELKIGFFDKFKRQFLENLNIVKLQKKIASELPIGVDSNSLFKRLNSIGRHVPCAHNPSHALAFILDMLEAPREIDGCFVEAGCFKGGSTAKFSIIAKMLGRKIYIFDSFEGLPENEEQHVKSLEGHQIEGWFEKGKFSGALEEVKHNISSYGEIDVCVFIQGWFENTMPDSANPVLAAFIDVDLASSTRTCLKYLYPRLVNKGVLCSQDEDFPLVVDVFNDSNFWKNEVGVERPLIDGLGQKITHIRKKA